MSKAQSFEQFIITHKDEITALQILYSYPHQQRVKLEEIKELAAEIKRPQHRWTAESLWRAYKTLDCSSVRGSNKKRLLTDLIALVRFALREEQVLKPYQDSVCNRFENWLARQQTLGANFTEEQCR